MESRILFQPIRPQSTIAKPVSVSGFGFWSGQDVTIEFQPAPQNTGVIFVRTDLPNHPRIPAIIQNRVPGPRRTTLVGDGCPVEMVEHVMAALAGLEIDNVEIHVDRAEMPGMDGSSIDFVNALIDAGIETQDAMKSILAVQQNIFVSEGGGTINAEPTTSQQAELTYQLDYPHVPSIGKQICSRVISREEFIQEIAPARTFLTATEAEQLKSRGLGHRVSYQDVLVFDEDGPIDNPLRFANECARHKLLDMIGDFALSGKQMIGNFTATRSGHRLNSQMVFALYQQNNQKLRQTA